MPEPLQRSRCKWVANMEDLQAMLNDLAHAEVLAVDVEHHHMHSYLGLVCLLQLYAGNNTADMSVRLYSPYRLLQLCIQTRHHHYMPSLLLA